MVTKVFITNNVIEVYEYDTYFAGKGGKRERKKKKDEVNNIIDRNYKNHNIKRLNDVRRYATANFNRNSTFITLTFDDSKVNFDIRNVKECNYEFKKFIQRLKRVLKKDDFKYLAVIEFQDLHERGAVHYHMLCNLPFIDINILNEAWGLGFVYINKIDHVDNVGAYLVKYITKDGGDIRLQGLKAFLHSNNLFKPETIINLSEETSEEFTYFETLISKLETVYECDYMTETFGKCHYKQFNTERGLI